MRILLVLITIALAGCQPGATGGGTPAAVPQMEEPDAPKGQAIADAVLQEARSQADAILSGLFAGKYDDDWDSGLAAVARKLKGYQSYAIKSQNLDSEKQATFAGVLTGPASQARFDVLLVKQQSGQWAVGTFGGPERK